MSHSKLSLFEKDGSSMASNDASFDSMASSLIPAGQRRRDTPDLFTPSSKGSVATCNTAKVVKTHVINYDQCCHGTGKTGNLDVHFSRQRNTGNMPEIL